MRKALNFVRQSMLKYDDVEETFTMVSLIMLFGIAVVASTGQLF